MRIIKIPLDGTIFLLSFLISLVNGSTLMAITVITPIIFLFLFKQRGALLAFILIQLRSILNPGLFAQYEGAASIAKWAIVFLLSFALFLKASAKRLVSRLISFATNDIIISRITVRRMV